MYSDRVQETSTTTGFGTITLLGAVPGFHTFASTYANGDRVRYYIAGGTEWETGEGTYSAGTLTRDTVLESSNAGSNVNFSGGITRSVACSQLGKTIADMGVTLALRNCVPIF